MYFHSLDERIDVRINAVDITSQLIEEHGLQKAYQVALNGAAEATKTGDNYLLSVMSEVKAKIRSKIVDQVNASQCSAC